jgi:nucleoside-diphosphate-sugar epimerase
MSERRPTLVLTGATGFIGKHIASFFAARNWMVVALVRHMPAKPLANVLYFRYDFTSPGPVVLPDTIDAFIHAGYVKQGDGHDAFEANTSGAKKLLAALDAKKAKQKIFLSSLSADENALSVYGKQKAAVEKLFLETGGAVIRAGLVLGDGGLFGAMRNYLRKSPRIPLFGDGRQPVQTVYIDDLVEATGKIIDKEQRGTFVVATDEPVQYREFYSALAATVGTKPRFTRLPFWLAGLLIGAGKLFGVKLPVTKDNLLGLQAMKRISSASDLEKLGIALRDHKASFAALQGTGKAQVN